MPELKVGQIYRYSRPYAERPEVIDGLPNFFSILRPVGRQPKLLLDAGINTPKIVRAIDGNRRPGILISSSPHKAGTHSTPWTDSFDHQNGHVRYYGDNRDPGREPSKNRGNAALLHEARIHSSPHEHVRRTASPIFVFKRVAVDSRLKGNVLFVGLAILVKTSAITQTIRSTDSHFKNYVFDLALLNLSSQMNSLDCSWMVDRRNPRLALESTMRNAPPAWRKWIETGTAATTESGAGVTAPIQ
jgi:hypothetical protein